MFKYLILLILMVVIIYMIKNHVKIKTKTFFQKGFYKTSKPYGVYCYCGKQGKGKTYSVVEFLLENKDKEIYSNIKSIKGVEYTYINGINELLELRSKTNCIIVFDEIFTILQKGSKMNDDILDFLSQMRKREMIFITTAQEWLEINMTLRRYCRYQIECNMLSFFGYPILIKSMYDAEQMKWSQEENEYIAPIVSTTISHGLKKVISSYDTYEQIGKYSKTIEESDEVKAPQQELNKEELTIADATSISNRQVISQLTNILHKRNKQKEVDKTIDFTSIDKDFWGDLKTTDFSEQKSESTDLDI